LVLKPRVSQPCDPADPKDKGTEHRSREQCFAKSKTVQQPIQRAASGDGSKKL
jgi:hypothetical protein